jgi:hypothetical protein
MPSNSLGVHAFFRGALITYGVAFFSWWFSRTLPSDETLRDWTPGSVYMIAVGLGLQLLMLAVKWFVARCERDRGMAGTLSPTTLSPTAVAVVQLLIDGVTVLLFAIATFRSIAIIPNQI